MNIKIEIVSKLFSFLIALIIAGNFILPKPVEAAKKFVPKTKTTKSTGGTALSSYVRYRADKKGVLLSFSRFSGIDSVFYSFTYDANGIPQGAGGTITANNDPTSNRELLFGTCSTGVCTYHYNLSNARLTLKAKFSNGKTLTKIYRIKTY